jgi:hypothetical protein
VRSLIVDLLLEFGFVVRKVGCWGGCCDDFLGLGCFGRVNDLDLIIGLRKVRQGLVCSALVQCVTRSDTWHSSEFRRYTLLLWCLMYGDECRMRQTDVARFRRLGAACCPYRNALVVVSINRVNGM